MNVYCRASSSCIPAPNDLALRSADGDIVAHNDKLDAICFVGMRSRVLLPSQAEVQDVPCVVPGSSFSGPHKVAGDVVLHVLDNDHRSVNLS